MSKFFLSALLFFALAFKVYSQPAIVYTSSQNPTGLLQVFIMNEDGSGKRQLTNLPTNCMYPRWSTDGSKIVFQTDDGRIFLIKEITESGTIEPYFVFGGTNPTFFPNEDLIVFNSEHEGVNTIYVMSPEDSEAMLLATDEYSNQQVISQDGSKMIYSGFEEGSKSVFLADLDDTTDNYLKKISVNNDANLEPDISSDNQNFVYAGFDNNLKGTIYANINGTEKALTKSMPSATQPKFSPDGKKIGFVVIEGTNVSLYIMDINGSNVKKLKTNGSVGIFRWVDNSRIIYDGGDGGDYAISITDINGGNTTLADGGINIHPDFLRK